MKSKRVAYILWAFSGAFGGHRFYLRHYGSGLMLLALTVFTCGLGAIAGAYDYINIKRLVEEENKPEILRRIKEEKRV
jgi:TM2 domain-containing membrane protein YozV